MPILRSILAATDSFDIFSIVVKKDTMNIEAHTSLLVIAILVGIIGLMFLPRLWKLRGNYEFDEAEFGIGAQKFKFKANHENLQIAYKMWVELSTRKVGLVVDAENDVVTEVYNSWYEFFKVMRELLKEIPAQQLRTDESSRVLVQLATKILNNELRPHLARWQAEFRRWYEAELANPANKGIRPQTIQQNFPQYADLIEEMQRVNNGLVSYRLKLEKIVLPGSNRGLSAEG